MKKIVGIVALVLGIILILLCVIMFTDLGNDIRVFVYEELTLQKEIVEMEEPDKIKITYTYWPAEEKFDIEITDKELIKLIQESIADKKLKNYSSSILLAVSGYYNVDLDNGVSFMFDNYDKDGYVMLNNNGNQFLTVIKPEILKQIVDKVDVVLAERASIFKTDKVTIKQGETAVEITEKTALEYILNQCKNIYSKKINYMPEIKLPDYEIDFNNNIKLYIYKKEDQGWLEQNDTTFEARGLTVFDTILENALTDMPQKKDMFTADKITIEDKNKSIEITDKDVIEKITTPLIYSTLGTPDWLKDYDITKEYDGGIRVKINEYEYLIPGKVGTVNIGNRYIISENKEISLCFPLISIDNYVNELLGNKIEEPTGTTIIAVPQ